VIKRIIASVVNARYTGKTRMILMVLQSARICKIFTQYKPQGGFIMRKLVLFIAVCLTFFVIPSFAEEAPLAEAPPIDASVITMQVITINGPLNVVLSYEGGTLSSQGAASEAEWGKIEVLPGYPNSKTAYIYGDKPLSIRLTGNGEGSVDFSLEYRNESKAIVERHLLPSQTVRQGTLLTGTFQPGGEKSMNYNLSGASGTVPAHLYLEQIYPPIINTGHLITVEVMPSGMAGAAFASRTHAVNGAFITLNAQPDVSDHYTFIDWTTDSPDIVINNATSMTGANFMMRDEPVKIYANMERFVPLTDITSIPSAMVTGDKLTLNSIVVPPNATNQTITWSIKNAGTTGALIYSNILRAEAAGTVEITATVENGLSQTTDFTRNFTIQVTTGGAPGSTGVGGIVTVTYPLTVTAGTGGRILTGQGSYTAGSLVNVSAEALPGYKFDRWTTGVAAPFANIYSSTTTFTMPSSAVTIVASFSAVNADTTNAEVSALPSVFISDNGVSPYKITFYPNDPQDISISLRTGLTYLLRGIRLGSYKLVEGTDYYIDDEQYLISAKFLSTLKKGDNIFTFDLNAGIKPQLIISVKSK
jgi:hypothetical protein